MTVTPRKRGGVLLSVGVLMGAAMVGSLWFMSARPVDSVEVANERVAPPESRRVSADAQVEPAPIDAVVREPLESVRQPTLQSADEPVSRLVVPPRRLKSTLETMRAFRIDVPLSPQLEPGAWEHFEQDWETLTYEVNRATAQWQAVGKRLVDAKLSHGDYQMFDNDHSDNPDKPWYQRDNGEFVVARFSFDVTLQRERVRVVRILPGEFADYDQQLAAKTEALRIRKQRLEFYFSK